LSGKITINPISTQNANTPFTVSGTFVLTPNFDYKDNSGTLTAFPTGSVHPATPTENWSFTHPGAAAGTLTVTVKELSSGATASVSVTIQNLSESPNGTVITPTNGAQIVEANGTVVTWVSSNGGQIDFTPGGVDPVSANVTLIEYWNHALVQKNSAGNWYSGTLSNWSQIAVSNSGSTIADTTGMLLDNSGNLITFQGGQVWFNGTVDTKTANAQLVLWYANALYYENTSGVWFQGTQGSWSQIAGDPRNSGGTGLFQVTSGGLKDPNGNPFVIKSVSVWEVDAGANGGGNALSTGTNYPFQLFPGLNAIRLNIFSSTDSSGNLVFPTAASYDAVINTVTNNGAGPGIIMIDYHNYGYTATGTELSDIATLYSGIQARHNGNKYLWFCGQNEPGNTNLGPMNLTLMQAVRNAGNQNPFIVTPHGCVFTDGWSGWDFTQFGTNWMWDLHCYGWMTGGGAGGPATSVSNCISTATSYVQGLQGVYNQPVYCNEFGEGAASSTIDGDGGNMVAAVETMVNQGLLQGCSFWEFHSDGYPTYPADNACGTGGDPWTSANQTITSYGNGYKSWLATGTPSTAT
jgi:hypothetical protein